MGLFRNKYRIESTRLASWDYSSNAPYFITICTSERIHDMGRIIDNEMHLSELGEVADQCWNDIPRHFPFVELGEYVIMPNHIHGVLIINRRPIHPQQRVETQYFASPDNTGDRETDLHNIVLHETETQNIASLPANGNERGVGNKFGAQSGNIASIVRGFKIGVIKYAKAHNIQFRWQPRYYDHIIKDETSYKTIRHYILTNPEKW